MVRSAVSPVTPSAGEIEVSILVEISGRYALWFIPDGMFDTVFECGVPGVPEDGDGV